MSWQVSLGLCLYIGWVGFHSWLGQRRLKVPLILLIGVDLAAFAGTWLWIAAQDYDASAGMAVGLAIFGAAALFIIPAIVGTFSLYKHLTKAL